MAKPVMLTADGLKQLEEELDLLKGEKRKEIAEKIKAGMNKFEQKPEDAGQDNAASEANNG
jgi:transcription elongation factor GreA